MISFHKYHGAGNDFILFLETDVSHLNDEQLAKTVCNRHTGIGADGMIIVALPLQMMFYNADGSRATMCGNGIRCFAKYVVDYQLVKTQTFSVLTDAGVQHVKMIKNTMDESLVEINMGLPQFEHESIPVLPQVTYDKSYDLHHLVLGTIHTVIRVPVIDEQEVQIVGALLSQHPSFLHQTNVNFCEVIDSKTLKVWTYEKGVGLTQACGTGATASAYIAHHHYGCCDKLRVLVLGGELSIELKEDGCYMTGPAKYVAYGTFIESLAT